MTVLQRIDQGLFGWGSALTLGVYRAVFCSLIFINLVMVAVHFEDWFTESGLVPVAAGKAFMGEMWRVNVLEGVTDTRITLGVYILTTLAALTSALGLWTRVSTIILAIGLISLHHRNSLILHSGDTLMRITAIYFVFMPVGAAFSLDRWLAQRRGREMTDAISLWPQRLIQIQMAVLYFTTVWHKLTGFTWWDGTAAWYPPHLLEFQRFPVPAWFDQPPFLQAATWGTLVIELALATLVFWRPARKWVLLGGILLHCGIEYRFNIPLFAFLSMAQYICHYDGDEIRSWWDRVSARLARFRSDTHAPTATPTS